MALSSYFSQVSRFCEADCKHFLLDYCSQTIQKTEKWYTIIIVATGDNLMYACIKCRQVI